MIISASRRTDIPSCHFEWFANRLRERYVLVRNPMNKTQVGRVDLSPEAVDCIVFWTKNPEPMLNGLDILRNYAYYVQYTVNPYGEDIETNLPSLGRRLETFRKLSDALGPDRVVWRYSPVLINERYTPAWHADRFDALAHELAPFTRQCKLSFLDMYAKIRRDMESLGADETDDERKRSLAKKFASSAKTCGIELGACGNLNLEAAGIPETQCVDAKLIARITGKNFFIAKDPNQRRECHCATSVDIGAYDTCMNGCRYCYANHSAASAKKRWADSDLGSPMLCSTLSPEDRVTERKVHSPADRQLKLFPE